MKSWCSMSVAILAYQHAMKSLMLERMVSVFVILKKERHMKPRRRRKIARWLDWLFRTDWVHFPREDFNQLLDAHEHHTPPEHPTPSARSARESQILAAFRLGQAQGKREA